MNVVANIESSAGGLLLNPTFRLATIKRRHRGDAYRSVAAEVSSYMPAVARRCSVYTGICPRVPGGSLHTVYWLYYSRVCHPHTKSLEIPAPTIEMNTALT